jgi:hypothetical protein
MHRQLLDVIPEKRDSNWWNQHDPEDDEIGKRNGNAGRIFAVINDHCTTGCLQNHYQYSQIYNKMPLVSKSLGS